MKTCRRRPERELQRPGSEVVCIASALRFLVAAALLVAHCRAVTEDRTERTARQPVQLGPPDGAQPGAGGGVPLPPHLRALAEQPGSGAASTQGNPRGPVPVILSVAPGSTAGAVDAATGKVLDAGAVNATRCIRYARGWDPLQSHERGGQQPAAAAYMRPPLDLSGCAASRTVVVSASQEVAVQVRANALAGSLPAGAVQVAAGEVVRIQPPTIEGAVQVFNVTVRVAAPDAIGQASAASNSLVLVWDTSPPQPSICQAGKYSSTDESVIPLLLDFGERVRELNLLNLFNITGAGRVDVIYEVLQGRIFLFCNVSQPEHPSVITVTIPPNVTTDVAGHPNEGASLSLVYLPTSNASAALGKAVNYVFAASSGAFVAGALTANAMNPLAVFPTGNDLGAMFGRVQATFLVGQLNLPTLPVNYRTTAGAFSWIQMNFPIPGGGGEDEKKDEEKKKRKRGAGAVLLKSMQQGGIVFPSQPRLVMLLPSGRSQVQPSGAASSSPPPVLSPPPPSPPPPAPPPPSVCSGVDFSPCTGQSGACANGECLCVAGGCTCVTSGPTTCTSGQTYCGLCGLCKPSSCDEQGPPGLGSYKNHLCYALSPAACSQGKTCATCGPSTVAALQSCQVNNNNSGRRRLREAHAVDAPPALPAVLQQARQAQHHQLSSAELNALLHAAFWEQQAQQGLDLAPMQQQQQQQQQQPHRRLRQEAGAPAPAPAAPSAKDVVDGGQIYVVASTGGSNSSSPDQASGLPLELLGIKLEGVIDELQLLFYQLGGASLRDLWNTMFWLWSIVIWRRWRMLMFFEWPRPEIWFLWCLLPIMAAQGAKCVLDGSPGALAAGIWFGFLIPIGLILLAVWLVAWNLLRGDAAQRSAYYTPTVKAMRRRRKRLGRAGSSGSRSGSAPSSAVDTASKLGSILSGKLGNLDRVSGSIGGSEASRSSGDDPGDSMLGATLLHTPPRQRDPPLRSQSHNAAWQAGTERVQRGPLFRSASHGMAWPPPPPAVQQRGTALRSLSHNVRSTPEEQPCGLLRSLSSDAWRTAQRTAGFLRSLSGSARQPSLQLQRGMPTRSLSSDARHWADCAQRAAAKAAAAKAAAAAAAAAAEQQQRQLRQPPPPRKRGRFWLGRWLARYILTPVFGFVARYGVLFETARGPEMEWRPGTFEFDPVTGRFDRGEMLPLATTRAARAREAAQTLGVTLQLAKMVAFAQLAAVFSVSHGHGGLWQLTTLLVLILLYWAYVRLLAPLAAPSLAAEIISCACDLATFVCGIIVISLPVERYQDINRLGIAMLVFQVVGMLCHCLRYCLQQAVEKAGRLWRRWRPGPAERFATAVHEVMARDEHILARKFADRWLLKVHGRGLNQRSLHAHERKRKVLPFALGSLSLPLSLPLSSSGSSRLRSSMSVRLSSVLPPLGFLGSTAGAEQSASAAASEDGAAGAAGKGPPSRLPSLVRR
ncbi:hypothetical protein ABPG75_000210 [Micractinium tetrahymenae]